MDQHGDPPVSDRSRPITSEGQLSAVAGLKPLEFREIATIY
jgi:hypothetical protein